MDHEHREDALQDFSIPRSRRLAVCVFALALSIATAAPAGSTVPFTETFSDSDGTTLDGLRGWASTGGGTATVQGARARLQNVQLSNAFDPLQNAVKISFDVAPQFATNATFPSSSRFRFYVSTNGLVTAYDGANPTKLSHTPLIEGSNVSFSLEIDYPLQRWSLLLGGVSIASDLALSSGDIESKFEEITFEDTGTNGYSYVDNVNVLPMTTENPFVLPFNEPFDSLDVGALNDQRGWSAAASTVQSTSVGAGLGGAITNRSGSMEHSFIGGTSSIWTQVQVRPSRGVPPSVPAGSTFAYYVNSNGVVVAYNGTVATALTNTYVGGSWVTFTTYSDYSAENWDLYLNGRLVADDFGFYTTNVAAFTAFGLSGGDSTQTAYVDNVYAGLKQPRFRLPGTVLVIR